MKKLLLMASIALAMPVGMNAMDDANGQTSVAITADDIAHLERGVEKAKRDLAEAQRKLERARTKDKTRMQATVEKKRSILTFRTALLVAVTAGLAGGTYAYFYLPSVRTQVDNSYLMQQAAKALATSRSTLASFYAQ